MAEGGQPRPVQDGEQEYAFRNVELYKTETLGTGAYGAVCKAKCDELICAAKLLYPVLFEMQPQAPEPGKEHRQPFRRFELECRFLSRINHPNIVQYLGTYRDPDTNAPVLLMELMDESLTHFLESSPGPIPYHVQVNHCYDIAQALAFLHSNGIIHRDISSDNVLLISGRAKVADFGMSKLIDTATTRLATMTTCPGTPAFMSPEALNEPPVYTEKLDNFSLGVLIVQIVTRKFPDPSNRFQVMQVVDPRFPRHTVQAQVPVPEEERRHAHISLIDPTHPLLPIALHCLKDKEVERPSSQQLCQTLGALKETAMYDESSKGKNQLLKDKDGGEDHVQDISSQLQQHDVREEQVCVLDTQVTHSDVRITLVSASPPDDINTDHIQAGSSIVIGNKAYFKPYSDSNFVYKYNSEKNCWLAIQTEHPQTCFTIVCIDHMLTSVGGRDVGFFGSKKSNKLYSLKDRKWVERFPPMPTKRQFPAAVHTNNILVVAGGYDGESYLDVVEILNIQTRQWSSASPLPTPRFQASTVLWGDHVYVTTGCESPKQDKYSVLKCSLTSLVESTQQNEPKPRVWEKISDLLVSQSSLVSITDQMLAVGGRDSNDEYSNKIHKYDLERNEWKVIFRMANAKACFFTAVLSNNKLLVSGYTAIECRMLLAVQIFKSL